MGDKDKTPLPAKKDEKANDAKKDDKKEEKKEELSEEDLQIKEEVDGLVLQIHANESASTTTAAIERLRTLVKTATGTVTSIPKPLKYLRSHYDELKTTFQSRLGTPAASQPFADILSLLAMSCNTDPTKQEVLNFKLLGTTTEICDWGHEYIRYLSGEIGLVYNERKKSQLPVDDLMGLVDQTVPFNFKHNSEPQACDLLAVVERLPDLVPLCTLANHNRVCQYLLASADYADAESERRAVQKVVYDIYTKVEKWSQALRIAMIMSNTDLVGKVMESCTDSLTRKQLGFQLAQHRHFIPPTGDDDLDEIISNTKLSELFLYTARDLNTMAPKTPQEIYKSNQDPRATALASNISSHTQNLASTFVNAFANAAFCTDKLMTTEGNEWLHKNKDHRMMSAAASLGLVMLWDVNDGLAQVDKFLYSSEEFIKAGALMAVGILHCGVRNECDPALALLSEYLTNKPKDSRIAAIMGLGLAYAGSRREELSEMLLPILGDTDTPLDVCVFTALALGLVFVGSCDENITELITTALMERAEKADADDTLFRFLCVALGLLFLGQAENVDAVLVAIGTLNPKVAKYCELTVRTCAYAGSGNIDQVKELIQGSLINKVENEEQASHQGVAVLGIGLVAMGEVLGMDMSKRTFEHILQNGDPVMRRAIPLALAMVSVSSPTLVVMDSLGKLSHDPDELTSLNAIFGLGIAGAGTNNARIANMLRQLATYYAKEANHLFMVRVAQGLLVLGKGLLTLTPFHSDRKLMDPVAMAGLLIVLHAGLDMKGLILNKHHFLLFFLVCAIRPRMMITVDGDCNPVPVSVRVGTAVDTVAIPGHPRTITSFQTHKTPVLLQGTDRAEFEEEKYRTTAAVLEGVVVVEKVPGVEAAEEEAKKE